MTESYEHVFLKEIALIWLRQRGYLWLGTEIPLDWPIPQVFREPEFPMKQLTLGGVKQTWHNRHIIDCIGIKRWYREYREHDYPPLWGCGIEAKVNRRDYLSGFCFDRLNTHFIIAPRNVVPKSTLPERVGLLEVGDVTINEFGELIGVRIAKTARAVMLEFPLKPLIETMCRHTSIKLVKTLKTQLPYKRKPVFKTEKLPEILERKERR